MAISLGVERAQIGSLLEALRGIGLNPRQMPGGRIWEARTGGWRLEVNQVTQAAIVVNAERLGEQKGTRRLMSLVSPNLQPDPDSGSLTLSNSNSDIPQEAVLFSAGGVIFRPEFDPTKL